MKNPKYSKDSFSWDISDLSGARKLKTFTKGRFLCGEKKKKRLLVFFFFFSIMLLPESQTVFRMCKLEADWLSAAVYCLGLLKLRKSPNMNQSICLLLGGLSVMSYYLIL